MSKLWVIGAGQLGAMMRHAAMPLNIDVEPIDFNNSELQISVADDDFITAEIERWTETEATRQLSCHPNFCNLNVFPLIADRFTQKKMLDDLSIPTAPWQLVESSTTAEMLYQQINDTVLLKRRTGGYDGRGQFWLKQSEATEVPESWHEESIAEKKIPFDEEVSLVGVRGMNGEMHFYPLTLNLHLNGILMASISPLERLSHLQSQAESMLGKLLTSLNYVGVMAMECFRVGDELMVNELAPRVHNSGHWTQAGASLSQFECHVRAVTQLPLSAPSIKGHSAMINLIGVERNDAWLAVSGAELYWYGKEVRPGRKVGHVNVCQYSIPELRASMSKLENLFPEPYPEVFEWVLGNLPK